MKTVLVTGGSGQLAKCLASASTSLSHFNFIFASHSDLDLTDENSIASFFQKHNFDYCINCAAYTAVDKAESDIEKAQEVNVEGVKKLALSCLKQNVTLIHISTDFVFDGLQTRPYLEEDKTNPLGVYGLTKLKGEEQVEGILEKYFIIRTSWLYSEFGANFMKSMIRLGKEKEKLGVVSDQKGTPTYARDLANFIIHLLGTDSKNYGLYHFSNMGETTWYGFAKLIFEKENIKIDLNPINTEDYPVAATRPPYSVLSKSKVLDTFNYTIPSWEESLSIALSKNK